MGYHEQPTSSRNAKCDPALFSDGMVGVCAGYRELVRKCGTRFLERHLVLSHICRGLFGVPNKTHVVIPRARFECDCTRTTDRKRLLPRHTRPTSPFSGSRRDSARFQVGCECRLRSGLAFFTEAVPVECDDGLVGLESNLFGTPVAMANDLAANW